MYSYMYVIIHTSPCWPPSGIETETSGAKSILFTLASLAAD